MLTLSQATNAILRAPTNATLLILDDDNPHVFFSSDTYLVFENINVATIGVWLSKPFSEDAFVDYAAIGGSATPGSDYVPTSGTLHFLPGQTNKTFFLTLFNDTLSEPDETVHLTLSNLVGAGAGATTEADAVIYDDDRGPRLSLSSLNGNQHFQA